MFSGCDMANTQILIILLSYLCTFLFCPISEHLLVIVLKVLNGELKHKVITY